MSSAPLKRNGSLLATLLAGQFMANVDAAVANVAAPSIRTTLHASAFELDLVISGYVFAYALFLMPGARFGDRFGYRRVFFAGTVLFTLASLACGFAPDAGMLIAARIVQGVGAALMVSQVLLGITLSFTGAARSHALGLYALALSGSAVAGQILGGVLVWADLFGSTWRPVFLVNVTIGAALIAASLLDRSSGGRGSGAPLRLMRLGVLRIPAVAWGLLALSASFTTYAALLFTIALYLQQGLGASALFSGLSMVSWVAAFGAGGYWCTRLPARAGAVAIPAGFLVLAAAFAALGAVVSAGRPATALFVTLLGVGGFGFGQRNGLVAHLTRSIPLEDASDLSGLVATSAPVAGSLGVAVFGTAYLRLASTAGSRDAFATVVEAFALTALLSAFAAHRSLRAGAHVTVAAAGRTG